MDKYQIFGLAMIVMAVIGMGSVFALVLWLAMGWPSAHPVVDDWVISKELEKEVNDEFERIRLGYKATAKEMNDILIRDVARERTKTSFYTGPVEIIQKFPYRD